MVRGTIRHFPVQLENETTVYSPGSVKQGGRGDGRRSNTIATGIYELDAAAVSARFRWARRRGRPQWLWPEIPVAEWRVALTELERVAGALLVGDAPVRLSSADGLRQRSLGLAAYTSGLGPWLGWQIERGALHADAAAATVLADHLEHARRRVQRLTAALHDVLEVFAAARIRATVLKGMHTSHTYFAEPALRPMADLDVSVAPGDIVGAERALRDAGYAPLPATQLARPYRTDWRPPGTPVELRSLALTHADDPFQVDLHGTLDINFFGVRTIRFGDSAAQHLAAAPWPNAFVLGQPLLSAQHAVHASQGLHGLTLIRLVELVLMVRRDFTTAEEWTSLHTLLRRLRAERFAYPAFALAEKLVPGTVPPSLLQRLDHAATPRLRGIIDGLRPATAQRLEDLALDERFMWSAGIVEHARRVGHMLLPTGVGGSVARLGRIYADRAFRLLRGRVSWRSDRA